MDVEARRLRHPVVVRVAVAHRVDLQDQVARGPLHAGRDGRPDRQLPVLVPAAVAGRPPALPALAHLLEVAVRVRVVHADLDETRGETTFR